MKTTYILSTLALSILSVTAAPTAPKIDLSGVDFSRINYPKGTGASHPHHPAPPGGWSSISYPGKPVSCPTSPFTFTSTYHVTATPDQVVSGTTPTGGLPGAVAYLDLGINADEDYVCYSIKLVGYKGEYQSLARTATHVHEAGKGMSGPPRMVFMNPVVVGEGGDRVSRGCVSAPYTTGINGTGGMDTGAAFSAKQIEKNPAGFFFDIHSSLAVPGAVRGQIA